VRYRYHFFFFYIYSHDGKSISIYLRLAEMSPASLPPTEKPQFLALAGPPAYSPFRLDALQSSINNLLSGARSAGKVTQIRTLYVHYANPVSSPAARSILAEPTSAVRQDLEALLFDAGAESGPLTRDAGTEVLRRAIRGGEASVEGKQLVLVYVSPRKGTISPWSSKATSIAHVCGLEKFVERIERGIVFGLEVEGGEIDVNEFADSLHDRMTQVWTALPRHNSSCNFNPIGVTDPRIDSPNLRCPLCLPCPSPSHFHQSPHLSQPSS